MGKRKKISEPVSCPGCGHRFVPDVPLSFSPPQTITELRAKAESIKAHCHTVLRDMERMLEYMDEFEEATL